MLDSDFSFTEIERKYLVVGDSWKSQTTKCIVIKQWYLSKTCDLEERIRIEYPRPFNKPEAFRMVKETIHDMNQKCDVRKEYVKPISEKTALKYIDDANVALPYIEKMRYFIQFENNEWVIDQYLDPSIPTICEIELNNIKQRFKKPDWVGREITKVKKYKNYELAKHLQLTK